jgi:hypothetical protein
MPAFDGVDDFVGIGNPLGGLGTDVVLFEEATDGGLKVDNGAEDAALQSAFGQGREETLDGIEP